MLALLITASLLSTNSIQGIAPPEFEAFAIPEYRYASGIILSNSLINDAFYSVYSNAVKVSDNLMAFTVSNTVIVPTGGNVVSNQSIIFSNAGWQTVYLRNSQGLYQQQVYFASNTLPSDTNFLNFGAGTLGSNLTASVLSFVGTNGAAQWNYSTGNGFTRSTNCWAYKIHGWSAFINGNNTYNAGYSLHLISTNWAVMAGHAFGYGQPWLGPWKAEGEDGQFYTNWIMAGSALYFNGTDVGICQFSNAWPQSVFYRLPFFPTNFVNYFNHTVPNISSNVLNVPAVWCRRNDDHVNVEVVSALNVDSGWNDEIAAYMPLPGAGQFYESFASGGDSSSPFYFCLGTNLIMGFALHTALLSGPFVSSPDINLWIATNIYPDTVNYVNLSGYPTF